MVAALVTALALTPGVFGSIEPANGELLVSGSTGRACVWLTVDPASLKATRVAGVCTRPPHSAHPIVPVVTENARSPWQAIHVGSTVLRYRDGSDTRPVSTYSPGARTTYGGGSLWAVTPVWSSTSAAQCTSAKVSRIDATTGRETTIATVPSSGFCSLLFDPQGLTFAHGALYFLNGSTLERVQP